MASLPKYPAQATVGRDLGGLRPRKFRPWCATTDTPREVSYNGKVRRTVRAGSHRGPREGGGRFRQHGGVPVSTGWQEVQIACRGWSAGHVKSRPSFNCRSSFLSGCLTKQPRAMAPVGRASQSVAKSDSPRFTAWYGRGQKRSGLVRDAPCRPGTRGRDSNRPDTRVDVCAETSRDAGSTPAASISRPHCPPGQCGRGL